MNFQCQQNVKQLPAFRGRKFVFSAINVEGSEGIFSSTMHVFTQMLIMKKLNITLSVENLSSMEILTLHLWLCIFLWH